MQQQNQEQFGVDSFLNAVNLLYHSNDKDMKVKANKFLVDFETKVDSWDISFKVLMKDNLSEEAYYNALTILKRKIKYDFGNFSENPEYIEKLLTFFESNIDKFKKFKHYILINYCDCVGKAFLFTGDKFKSMLQKFTMKLYGQNADIESLISLLLIFNFICETSYDKRMVIDEKSRKFIKNNIKDISGDVFQFIIFMINKLNTIENNNLKNFITKQILDTLNNYLYIDLDEKIFLKFNNEYMPIINFIFQIDEENLEKHSECICNLLYLPLQKDNMRSLAQIIFSKILEFKDIFYKSIESLDTEQSSFYIDVFTSMVKNNMEEILKEKRWDFFQIIVDLTKKCPSNKIDTIGDFFKDFNIYLYDHNFSENDVMSIFKNLFIQLILNLMNLTKFDNEIFTKLNISKTKAFKSNDDYNTILDFRYSVKEILEDFVNNYDFNFIFEDILFPEFNKIILKIKENQKDIMYWSKLENILYIFSCIVRYINNDYKIPENVIILFHTIFDIPKEFIQITRIITDIIDNSLDSVLLNDKELSLKCFKYLVNCLENPLIIKYCSVSAKDLLYKNKIIMSELREDLYSLYEQLKNKLLESDKYLFIVEGIINVVSYSDENNNNYELIRNIIVKIMSFWVLYLHEAKKLLEKNNNLSPEDNSQLNKLLLILKSISKSVFDGLCEKNINIMYEILVEIWPSIIFILNKMSTNSDIVEDIIQLIKIYMRGLKDNFIKFIPEYVNCIINGYKLSPISSYLYAFEIMVTVYPRRKEKEIKLVLNNTFNELCKITLNGYIKKVSALNILTQIGEDFFGMLYRIMKISPEVILESEIFDTLINISLNYMNTSQIQIAKNIIIFLQYIIKFEKLKAFEEMKEKDNTSYQKYKTIIQNKINNLSSLLCEKILKIYVESSVEQIIESVNELFIDFISYQKPLAINSMKLHLQNFPNDILTNKEKNNFIKLIEQYSIDNNNNNPNIYKEEYKEEIKEEFDKFMENFINRCFSKQVRNRGQN